MSRSSFHHAGRSSATFLGLCLMVSGGLQAQGDHTGIEDGLAGPSGFVVPSGLGAVDVPAVDRAGRDRLANSFRSVALRLHAMPARRGDAAVLHVYAADVRGLDDARSLEDLSLAADLFTAAGNQEAACAALETTARVAVHFGRLDDARRSYDLVREMGHPGCSDGWGEFLSALVAPAPGPILVRAPEQMLADGTQLRLKPIAMPIPIEIDPPDLVPPISCEGEAVLQLRALTPPEILWPDV